MTADQDWQFGQSLAALDRLAEHGVHEHGGERTDYWPADARAQYCRSCMERPKSIQDLAMEQWGLIKDRIGKAEALRKHVGGGAA